MTSLSFIRENFDIHEWRHIAAILQADFPVEYFATSLVNLS